MNKKMMNQKSMSQTKMKMKTIAYLKMIKIMIKKKTTRIRQPKATTRLTRKTKKRMQDGYKKMIYKKVTSKGL